MVSFFFKDTHMENEIEWIRRAQGGDKDAFLALYRAHVDILYRTLLARTGHREMTEDIVQETFLRAIKALPRFRPEGGLFRAWLFRIAMNFFISEYRKQKRVAAVDPEILGAIPDSSPLGRVGGEVGDRDALLRALDQLDKRDQEMIMLRYFSEFSYEEIAAATGMSVNAIGVRLHRSMRKLKEKLGNSSTTAARLAENGESRRASN